MEASLFFIGELKERGVLQVWEVSNVHTCAPYLSLMSPGVHSPTQLAWETNESRAFTELITPRNGADGFCSHSIHQNLAKQLPLSVLDLRNLILNLGAWQAVT